MSTFCEARGVRLAPHGKTTLSPQLFHLQMQAGAWGMTVASMRQAQLCVEHGILHVLVANQVVDGVDVGLLKQLTGQVEGLELHFLVDSVDGLRLVEEALGEGGWGEGDHKVNALVELGFEGGRTGVRGVDAGVALAQAVAASARVRLSGVEVYEGLLVRGMDSAADVRAVEGIMSQLLRLVQECDARSLFTHPSVIVSAGGSAAFDVVADQLGRVHSLGLSRPAVPLLRSGCYLSHDHGLYSTFGSLITERLPSLPAPPASPSPPHLPPPPLFCSRRWRCGRWCSRCRTLGWPLSASADATSPATNTCPSLWREGGGVRGGRGA